MASDGRCGKLIWVWLVMGVWQADLVVGGVESWVWLVDPSICFCRWATTGLEFMIVACAPTTLAAISHSRFESVKKLMNRCVDHVVGEAPPTTSIIQKGAQRTSLDCIYSQLFLLFFRQLHVQVGHAQQEAVGQAQETALRSHGILIPG